jgi:hypothetical protein
LNDSRRTGESATVRSLGLFYFASLISTLPTRLMASASILASLSQNF